jgi:hypothetical protein
MKGNLVLLSRTFWKGSDPDTTIYIDSADRTVGVNFLDTRMFKTISLKGSDQQTRCLSEKIGIPNSCRLDYIMEQGHHPPWGGEKHNHRSLLHPGLWIKRNKSCT